MRSFFALGAPYIRMHRDRSWNAVGIFWLAGKDLWFLPFLQSSFTLYLLYFTFQVPESIMSLASWTEAFRFSTGQSGRCHYKSHLRDELLGFFLRAWGGQYRFTQWQYVFSWEKWGVFLVLAFGSSVKKMRASHTFITRNRHNNLWDWKMTCHFLGLEHVAVETFISSWPIE